MCDKSFLIFISIIASTCELALSIMGSPGRQNTEEFYLKWFMLCYVRGKQAFDGKVAVALTVCLAL